MALLLAINVPLSVSLAAMVVPDRNERGQPTMACHEPAAGQSQDEGSPEPSAALQHLCCFTACIPLAPATDAVLALALPSGEPLPALLPTRLMARAIGVDPPPPKA